MSNKMKKCSSCGAEIAKSAKVCPSCGAKNKKPIYQRPWFIVIAVILVLGIIGSAMGSGDSGGSSSAGTPSAGSSASSSGAGGGTSGSGSGDVSTPAASSEPAAPEITYEPCTADQLMDTLEQNALSAANTYENKYVELTGRLGTIDSSGKYISLMPVNNQFAFIGVTCYLTDDSQKDVVMALNSDDTVTVRGKITSVGEVLGYSLDIDEFVP